MKIVWIYPINQKCGISFYSQEYVKTLKESVEVDAFDIHECLDSIGSYINRLNYFDIIHIQYETSFFLKGNHKRYGQLCSQITKPIIVSLHEVYEEFPGVFPRSQIKGKSFTRKLKENIYDIRHPFQTLYNKHLSNNFYADKILIHANFQKALLIKKGIEKDKIEIIPMPIKEIKDILIGGKQQATQINNKLYLSSLGFLNQNYNYELLFDVLDKLEIPWHFTWIGGIRRNEDIPLHNTIKQEISKRRWEDKFTVTGWVSDERRNELLSQTDVYLALFSARSSSLSLATALGARRLIITTTLPFSEELVKSSPIMLISEANSKSVLNNIDQIISNNSIKKTCLNAIDKYIEQHSYMDMSKKLIETYRGIAA